jgi:hypothetical protein
MSRRKRNKQASREKISKTTLEYCKRRAGRKK